MRTPYLGILLCMLSVARPIHGQTASNQTTSTQTTFNLTTFSQAGANHPVSSQAVTSQLTTSHITTIPTTVSAVVGQASYYNDKFEGLPTASGEPYSKEELTAAHRTYAFGTRLRVTRADTHQSVEVRVNDRGPHSPHRVIDLSRKAAEQLDLVNAGVADVEIEVLPADPDDLDPPHSCPGSAAQRS